MTAEAPLIVVTCRVHDEVIALLEPHARLILNQSPDALAPAELRERARDATALLVFMCDRVDDTLLAECPQLRVVAGALKGYDNIDVAAATRRRVYVANVPGHLTAPTAELAVALLLGLARKVAMGDRHVRGGGFRGWRPILFGTGLGGRSVGIVGMGAVGQAIARRLDGFEASLSYYDPRGLDDAAEQRLNLKRLPLDDLLTASDGVILALPLTAETRHLLDRDRLRRLREGALLVNIGRGSVVEEEAVAEALEVGQLGGYAADVFCMEDLSLPDCPRSIPAGLLASERTLFTPHLGSAVGPVRLAIEQEAAANILDALAGKRPRGALNAW
jgi:phosphonate dehydrogenase